MMITRFLRDLKAKGKIHPRFVMTDKDMAQINSIRAVWPAAGVQLCYWHLKRAVKKHLASAKKPLTIRYAMHEPRNEFSFIDLDFYPSFSTCA